MGNSPFRQHLIHQLIGWRPLWEVMAVRQRQQTQGADLRQWVRHRTEKGDTHVYTVYIYIYIVLSLLSSLLLLNTVFVIFLMIMYMIYPYFNLHSSSSRRRVLTQLINLWLDTVVCLFVCSFMGKKQLENQRMWYGEHGGYIANYYFLLKGQNKLIGIGH